MTELETEIIWLTEPPPGVSPQTHRFTLLDAVECAAMSLGTDRRTEAEAVTVGEGFRVLVSTLPHLVASTIDEEGRLPLKNGKPFLGTIGCRHYYWTGEPGMGMKAEVSNGRKIAHVCVL